MERLSPPRGLTPSSVLAWGRKLVLSNSGRQADAGWAGDGELQAAGAAAAAAAFADDGRQMAAALDQRQDDMQRMHSERSGMNRALENLQSVLRSEQQPHQHHQPRGADVSALSLTSTHDDNAQIRETLTTVLRDLSVTEDTLRARDEELERAKVRCAELLADNESLAATAQDAAAVRSRLEAELADAGADLQQADSERTALKERVAAMEKEELLTGTAVMRLSEHLAAVECLCVQSRRHVQSLLKGMLELSQEQAAQRSRLRCAGSAPDALPPAPPPPPDEDSIQNQHQFLHSLCQQGVAVLAQLRETSEGFWQSASEAAETLSRQTEALRKVDFCMEQAQNKLAETIAGKERAEDELRDRDERLAAANSRVEQAAQIVHQVEERMQAKVAEAEGELGRLVGRAKDVEAEAERLRKALGETSQECIRQGEARQRAEGLAKGEQLEQERLAALCRELQAVAAERDAKELALTREVRRLEEVEHGLNAEVAKLAVVRAEGEREATAAVGDRRNIEAALRQLETEYQRVRTELAETEASLHQRDLDLQQQRRECDELRRQIQSLEKDAEAAEQHREHLREELSRAAAQESRAQKESDYFRQILLSKESRDVSAQARKVGRRVVDDPPVTVAEVHAENRRLREELAKVVASPPLPQEVPVVVNCHEGDAEPDAGRYAVGNMRQLSPPRTAQRRHQHWSPSKQHAQGYAGTGRDASADGSPSYIDKLGSAAERLRSVLHSEERSVPRAQQTALWPDQQHTPPQTVSWPAEGQQWTDPALETSRSPLQNALWPTYP